MAWHQGLRPLLHPLSIRGSREKATDSFGPVFHCTAAKKLLKFDFIGIWASRIGEKYILIVKHNLSDYFWLFASKSMCSEYAARAVINYCTAFGVQKSLTSDRPSHFKNKTIHLLVKGLKVPHYFSLSYALWSNEAVERLDKELLRIFQAVSSELWKRPEKLPDLLAVVQSALNTSPSAHRKHTCPATAFTDIDTTPAISTFF